MKTVLLDYHYKGLTINNVPHLESEDELAPQEDKYLLESDVVETISWIVRRMRENELVVANYNDFKQWEVKL